MKQNRYVLQAVAQPRIFFGRGQSMMLSVTDDFVAVENWYKTPAKILASLFWGWHGLFSLILAVLLNGGFRVGGDRGKTKKGALWWRHHTQPNVVSTFDQAYDTATQGYVPKTTAWLTYQEKMQKDVHDTQLWKHWKLGRRGWQHKS